MQSYNYFFTLQWFLQQNVNILTKKDSLDDFRHLKIEGKRPDNEALHYKNPDNLIAGI